MKKRERSHDGPRSHHSALFSKTDQTESDFDKLISIFKYAKKYKKCRKDMHRYQNVSKGYMNAQDKGYWVGTGQT